MKLAFSTLGNPDWSFERILLEGQKLGFDGIEIRGIGDKMLAEEIVEFFPENQKETQDALKNHGLKIIGFGTSVSFHDEDQFDKMLEEGKTSIDICQRMGIPFIRVFGDRISSEEKREEIIDRVIEGLRELCVYAEDKGVKVLQEIHGDFNTIENIGPIIEGLKDRKEYGIIWDIAHSDRIYKEDYKAFYELISPLIEHVHIKDHRRREDSTELTLVGQGDIPIKEIVRTLKDQAYDGYYSLEWEKRWHPELEEPEIAYKVFLDYFKELD